MRHSFDFVHQHPCFHWLAIIAYVAQLPKRKFLISQPGPQTIWLGLQRIYDLALAWNTFGPGAADARQYNNEGVALGWNVSALQAISGIANRLLGA